MPTGKGTLRIAVEDFLETFGFGKRIKEWLKDIIETWELEIFDIYDRLAERSGLDKYLPEWLKPGILTNRETRHQMEIGMVLVGILMMVIGMLIGVFAPAQRLGMYKIDKLAQSGRPSALETLAMGRRVGFDKVNPDEILSELGFPPELIKGYHELARQYLPELQYITAMRRNEMSLETTLDNLYKSGLSREDAQLLISISMIIPNPSDLVTMAVREAFDDEVSTRFQHDENFPREFAEWMKKLGFADEWSKRYWRSHWQLPSPQQVFEMFQRLRPGKSNTPTTEDDVKTYLRTADYAPFWRERLLQIAYQPYTRVDIRRMFKVRTLDEAQVKEAYLDLGYDEEHAQALTEFTIAYEAEEETGIVRSSVLSAYGEGMIDRSKAEGMLSTSGYDATTIAFYLDSVDFKEALDISKIKLTNIKKRFVEGLIDETQVNNEINALNLPSERTSALLELWLTERENQTALLSITQMEVLLERGIVSGDDYKRIAKRRGYSDETINWTMLRIAQEAAERAQKEAEKAQADAERLQKSKTASKYQKDKAEVDLAIAQARAEITDIDVALHGDVTEEQITQLLARKDELKLAISDYNVVKAQLRFDTTTALDNLVK